jgi:hypothetical protein
MSCRLVPWLYAAAAPQKSSPSLLRDTRDKQGLVFLTDPISRMQPATQYTQCHYAGHGEAPATLVDEAGSPASAWSKEDISIRHIGLLVQFILSDSSLWA